ncbi:MAG: hypothetical protein IMZ71_01995 [Chloroflexi bacterium]|nr:hypothetical protein [Chloroflexota bacterium]
MIRIQARNKSGRFKKPRLGCQVTQDGRVYRYVKLVSKSAVVVAGVPVVWDKPEKRKRGDAK